MSFKNSLLRVGRPTAMPAYGIHNPVCLEFLIRLRLGQSQLNEHKFKHIFNDCVNPICWFGLAIESPSHFFLRSHYFTNIRSNLLDDLKSIDVNIPGFPDSEVVELLLYGSPMFDLNQSTEILSSSFMFFFIMIF